MLKIKLPILEPEPTKDGVVLYEQEFEKQYHAYIEHRPYLKNEISKNVTADFFHKGFQYAVKVASKNNS